MTSPILVIDDDDAVRTTLRRILEAEGYTVVLAENGRRGLELLGEASPELVITDIIMPEKEGIETIIEMRRTHRDLKIIAVSGGGRVGNRDFLQLARKFGANEILAKPFDPDDVVEAVSRQLKGAA